MKPQTFIWGIAAVLLAAPSISAREDHRMLRHVLEDKIRGGWAGQMIGVSYGAPTEFRALGKILEGEIKWSPERVSNAIHQDDLYVEMTFARVMDITGLNASTEDYGEAFKFSKYGLWHANAAGRRMLNQGLKAPFSGHPKYNLHANDIDFQIEADFIGLMCPGLPRQVVHFCDRVGHVMNYGDGVYGGMFVCGMYSAAYIETDLRTIVEAGLACIPAKSSYAALIRDVLEWSAQNPGDWRKTWQMIEDKWDKDDPCSDGALAPFNIDAKINGAYIALGLLYGNGEFLKTMEISTRCGQDSDCNPSSAAGVLGVLLGFEKIPDEFKSGIPKLANKKFEFTDYSFNDICQSTLKRALALIAKSGGKVSDTEIVIPSQTPKPPKLEQWNPGIPYQKLSPKDAAWTWDKKWTEEKGRMVCAAPGAEATLKFTGVAVALIGPLDQKSGRATIYLDDKQVGVADAYIVPNTSDNALWHAYGLRSGEHTLKLVTRPETDPRSKGSRVAIEQAVIYRAPEQN